MRKKTTPTTVSLSEFGFTMTDATPRTRKSAWAGAARGFVGITATMVALSPIVIMGTTATANTAAHTWDAIPATVPSDLPLSQHSYMLDVNGTPFATFYSENRIPVTSAEIPDVVRNALTSTEDANFYTHGGVDLNATMRGAVATISGSTQGGSGITQQYVKNLLVANATTDEQVSAATAQNIGRKITEAKAALELEKKLTKDEIITGYLNTVYFGDGAYGIGAAARHYFNKTPAALTTDEAAVLVGIINSPTAFDPTLHPQASQTRRNQVLGRMQAEGYLTQAELTSLQNTPITLNVTNSENGCYASAYPFYCAWVRQTLADNPAFGGTAAERQLRIYRGGMTIRTALNPALQKKTTKIAQQALDPKGNPATAIAVVEPGTGRVPAIATNRDYGSKKGQTELLLPVLPSFQQGSTFKPLTTAAAIEAGYNPDYRFYAGDTYAPKNRNFPKGGFHNNGDGPGGDYDMAGALRHSVNTWFVEMEDKVGVRTVAETAVRMGLTSLPLTGERAITERDASLTLGSYEVSPLEVANTFATIAAHGVACDPTGIISITDAANQEVKVPSQNCRQAIRPSTADSVAQMLEGVIDHKDPGRTGKAASIGRPAGGKTGTTNTTAAVWFAGFTPQYATAVWIGDPRGGFQYPLDSLTAFGRYYSPVYGGGAPAEIWRRTMLAATGHLPPTPLAKGGGDTAVGVPLIIPDVRGMTPAEAANVLTQAGFNANRASSPGPAITGMEPGRVTKMAPNPGTIVDAYTLPRSVELFVND